MTKEELERDIKEALVYQHNMLCLPGEVIKDEDSSYDMDTMARALHRITVSAERYARSYAVAELEKLIANLPVSRSMEPHASGYRDGVYKVVNKAKKAIADLKGGGRTRISGQTSPLTTYRPANWETST